MDDAAGSSRRRLDRRSVSTMSNSSISSKSSGSSRRRAKGIFNRIDAGRDVKRIVRELQEASVEDYYKSTGWAPHVASSDMFKSFTILVVGLNALWIAIEPDINSQRNTSDAHWGFTLIDNLFCVFYTFELCVRFAAFSSKRDILKGDRWFIFDAVLVVLIMLETWVFTVVRAFVGFSFNEPALMTLLRMTRICRVARVTRLARASSDLAVLLKGMVVAMRSVFVALCLLVGCVYIFAVVFRELSDGTTLVTEHHYFTDVPTSMYTLVTRGLYMDQIFLLVQHLKAEGAVYVATFAVFMFLACHTMLSFMIGILCDAVTTIASNEKLEILVANSRDELTKALERLPEIEPNAISKNDFLRICSDPGSIRTFCRLGVDPVSLVELSDAIFQDSYCAVDGNIDFATLMDVVVSFRGSNVVTVKDLTRMRHEVFTRVDNAVKQLAHAANPADSECDRAFASFRGSVISDMDRPPSPAPESEGLGEWSSMPGDPSPQQEHVILRAVEEAVDRKQGLECLRMHLSDMQALRRRFAPNERRHSQQSAQNMSSACHSANDGEWSVHHSGSPRSLSAKCEWHGFSREDCVDACKAVHGLENETLPGIDPGTCAEDEVGCALSPRSAPMDQPDIEPRLEPSSWIRTPGVSGAAEECSPQRERTPAGGDMSRGPDAARRSFRC